MAVLIDSSILIAFERGQIDVNAHVRGREQEPFFISVISVSELLHGVHRARDLNIRTRRQAFVEGILAGFPILEIDLTVARAHASLWSMLESEGKMIGIHDSWIAATCLAHGFSLVTANVREFERIPGLQIENWLTRLLGFRLKFSEENKN